MPDNALFRRLCSVPVMTAGWYLAQADSRDDFVLDPVGHADFASNLSARLEYLIEQVKTNRYRPRHLIDIDVPKHGLSVRPGNVLPIEEAVLLHAITYLLAPKLDKYLIRNAVYSYRLHPDWERKAKRGESMFREANAQFPFLKKKTLRAISPFEAWYESWPEFEADAARAMTEEGYTHLTKTDITAYFENIDLRLLDGIMRDRLRREGMTLQVMFRILEGWTRTTSTGQPVGRGIPQGNEVSSFLGNMYLLPLDKALSDFCKRRDAKWFRYVDDVKVFTKSERDAREAVFIVNDALRALHLNLQGSKTEVLSGERLKQEMDNEDIEQVDAVFAKIRAIDRKANGAAKAITAQLRIIGPIASQFRTKLPSSVSSLSSKKSRLFRRLLTTYGAAARPHLRKAAVAALKQLPDLRILSKTLVYLSQLDQSTHSDSVNELLSLVEEDQLPFPYQIGSVLGALCTLHPDNAEAIASRVRQYSLTSKRHWFIVHRSLEAMSVYPYKPGHAHSIAVRFTSHEHPVVRRAACILLMRGPKDRVHVQLRKLIYHADPGVNRLAVHLLRLTEDSTLAKEEIGRMRRGATTDVAFQRRLTTLFGISATRNKTVANELVQYLSDVSKPKSERLRWYLDQLRTRVDWASPVLVSDGGVATTAVASPDTAQPRRGPGRG